MKRRIIIMDTLLINDDNIKVPSTFDEVDKLEEFDKYQKEEIKKGLSKKVDIRYYFDKRFNKKQMKEIRRGLENNVDVSKYAHYNFNHKQMKEIRLGLEEGIDVNIYCSSNISYRNMNFVRYLISIGEDVSGVDLSLPYAMLRKIFLK